MEHRYSDGLIRILLHHKWNLTFLLRCPSRCNGRRYNQRILHSQRISHHHQSMVTSSLKSSHPPSNSKRNRNMLHDREIYPDPFTFNPDRHIATAERPAQRDPRTICFGFGRRICPGMHLAEASLFSSIAMTLAVFDISKAVENGVEITPVHENTAGTIRCLFFCFLLSSQYSLSA